MNTTKQTGGRAFLLRTAALAALLPPLAGAAAPPVPPKNISTTGNLAFGRFAAAGGGSVSVAASGLRTRSGSVVLLASSAAPASFSVGSSNGNDNKVYVLTLPADGSVQLVSGANRMPVNQFVSNFTAGSPLPSGVQTVTVGASLQVSPSQAPGAYSGNFNVTLEYQ